MIELAQQVARAWFDDGQVASLGRGHIHDTFLLTRPGPQHYVLQRINQTVFKDPVLVMGQTKRLLECWGRQSRYRSPELVPNQRGQAYTRHQSEVWRLWRFIEPSCVVDPPQQPAQAAAVAAAFGYLQQCLIELSGPAFADPIEGFLQLPHYLAAYDEVAQQAPSPLRRLVEQHRGLAERFVERHCHIHGDCKVNNVLFDPAAQSVVAVIDFDTAMFGHWAWDFGDLVRSVCFSRGGADLNYFEACVRGFAPYQPRFHPLEAASAPAYVALMLAVRFLTDHLTGDKYFRVSQPGQNLQRAQQQFDLLLQFDQQQQAMYDIAADYAPS